MSLGLDMSRSTGFLAEEALKGYCIPFGKTSHPSIPGWTFPPSLGRVAWAAWTLAEPGLASAGDFPKPIRLCESPCSERCCQSHA